MTESEVPFSLGYGALSRMLASLVGSDEDQITVRFRKLRLRPFPDDIRSGTGNRVPYDLPRLLAFAGVFELNRLFIPQGHAADVVALAWPELCRAAIVAAVGAGAITSPLRMPSDATTVVRMVPVAFGDDEVVSATIYDGAAERAFPTVSIDQARVVRLLSAAAEKDGSSAALGQAFVDLEQQFGWAHPAELVRLKRTGSFLADGPYVARALALLRAPEADFDAEGRPDARLRLQWLLDYLEHPAPVDAWIAEGGTERDEPRLKHLIHFWAREMGLKSREIPSTIGIKVGSNLKARAEALLARV